jgi:hypothetical protein
MKVWRDRSRTASQPHWSVLFVVVAGIVSRGVAAQTPDQSDVGRFNQPFVPTAPPTPQEAAVSRDFRVIQTLPILGTNNAIGSSASAVSSGSPDGHATPDLLLRWLHQFQFVRLSASVDFSVDRFFINSSQDTNSLYWNIKAAFTDGNSDLFVPYVAYAGALDFGPGFAQWSNTLNNFYLGFTSGIGFGDGRPIAFRDSTRPGQWSISLDVAGGDRIANPPSFSNRFVVASADILYNVTADLRFGITPTIRFRNYPDYFGSHRRDLRLGFAAHAEWTPDWLTRINRGAELDFVVSFLRNRSTLASENYSQWEGGPALVLSWRF